MKRWLFWIVGGALITAVGGTVTHTAVSAPLPVSGTNRPALIWLIDQSGSMNGCDAGAAFAGFGDCNGGADYTRMTAAKVAIAQVMDANGDGQIDSVDESLLGIAMGFGAYTGPRDGRADSDIQVLKPAGTPYNELWCGSTCDGPTALAGICSGGVGTCNNSLNNGIEDIGWDANTPTGGAMRAVLGANAAPAPYPAVGNPPCANCGADFPGTKGSLFGCYDGDPTTACLLTPTNAAGDDVARSCRELYLVVMTDGESDSCERPPDAADYLYNGGLAPGTGPQLGINNVDGYPSVVSYGVLLGTGGDISEVNCISRLGGVDADRDGDGNIQTPYDNVTYPGVNGGFDECRSNPPSRQIDAADAAAGSCPNGINGSTPHYPGVGSDPLTDGRGNGFFANNAAELAGVFTTIVNQVNSGTFGRARPSVASPTAVANAPNGARNVYNASFEVLPNRIPWEGHFQKFLFGRAANDATYTNFLDCVGGNQNNKPNTNLDGDATTGTNGPNDPLACWDAGRSLSGLDRMNSVLPLVPVGPAAGPGRHLWYNRNLFIPLPKIADAGYDGFDKYSDGGEFVIMGAGIGASSFGNDSKANLDSGILVDAGIPTQYRRTYLVDLVDLAQVDVAADIVSLGAVSHSSLTNGTREARFVTASIFYTRQGQDYTQPGNIQTLNFTQAQEHMQWHAGHPLIPAADGNCRAYNPADCALADDTVPSNKMADDFEARPVTVTPPFLAVDDPDFNTFINCDQGSCDAVSDTAIKYHRVMGCQPGVAAPCAVKDRLRVAYTATNDGWLHAIQDEDAIANVSVMGKATTAYEPGDELWAVSLSHILHLAQLNRQQHTLALNNDLEVRDVKFNIPGEESGESDGKWHTVIFITLRQGGVIVAAVDVTDPANPKHLWELRKGKKLGNTFVAPSIGRLPPKVVNGLGNFQQVMFMPGGVQTLPGEHPHAWMTALHDPGKNKDKHIREHNGGAGLEDALTIPPALEQDMTARAPMVDLNADGITERSYLADSEGRIWKICKLEDDIDFAFESFADTASYREVPPVPLAANKVGKKDPPITGDEDQRGPFFYGPAITFAGNDEYYIVYGSGNIVDPLQLSRPNDNNIWSFIDTFAGIAPPPPLSSGSGGGADGLCEPNECDCARGLVCNEGLGNPIPFPAQIPGKIPLNDVLTGEPVIVNGVLLYTEFDADVNNDGDACADDAVSRLRAFQLLPNVCIDVGLGPGDCDPTQIDPVTGEPDPDCGTPIFNGGTDSSVVFGKDDGVISGPVVDGEFVFVGGNKPGSPAGAEVDLPPSATGTVRNWRQVN